MQLYRTPFSPAYWRDALTDSKKVKILVFSALMVAVCVALSYARSIPIFYNIRVTWGFLGRALCAMVCGPVNALAFGFVEDTVSYFMNPDGGYNPAYVITTMLGVLTYALFLYRAKVTVTRLFLAKLVTNLQNVFLGSLWTYLWYTDQGYWAVVSASALKNVAMLPVQALLLVVLFSAMMPVLSVMGLTSREADGLVTSRLIQWAKARRAAKS